MYSPKKQTNEFNLFAVKSKKANKSNSFTRSFVRFLGESTAHKSAFRFIWPLTLFRRYQLPFCGGCTNQSQISWLFQIWSLLSSGKVIFHFFCNFYEKNGVKIFFQPKKERFFDENGQKHYFLTNIGIFCFNYVISMLWEIFWGALHVCRSKIDDVENSFYIRHIFESPQPRGCSWRGYATQEADQELKWKLRTISVWKNWVLEFLGSNSWDTSKSPGIIGLSSATKTMTFD